MAYSYPIWIDVEACIYKSNKSYGARNTNKEKVYVGTSSRYSNLFYVRRTTKRELDEYRGFTDVLVFRAYHNNYFVEEMVISRKTREVLEHRKAEIKELT